MKAFTVARLGSDLDIRFMQDGTPVGQVSLAVRLGIKDKEGNYKTQWISASLFGKRAESLAPYLTKGSLHAFYLRDLHIDEFTGKDGNIRTSLKAIIDDVELCGSMREVAGAEKMAVPKKSKPAEQENSNTFSDLESDIPF